MKTPFVVEIRGEKIAIRAGDFYLETDAAGAEELIDLLDAALELLGRPGSAGLQLRPRGWEDRDADEET